MNGKFQLATKAILNHGSHCKVHDYTVHGHVSDLWTNSQEFQPAKKYVTSPKIVNDIAECRLKLSVTLLIYVITINLEWHKIILYAVKCRNMIVA